MYYICNVFNFNNMYISFTGQNTSKYFDKNDNFSRYIADIKNKKPLSKEEFKKLYYDYKDNGNMDSFNKIIEHNLLYALKSATRYVGGRIPYNDLIEACNMALIDALKKYDINRGCEFIAFANYYMLISLTNYCDSSYPVKLPVKVKKSIHKNKSINDYATFVNLDSSRVGDDEKPIDVEDTTASIMPDHMFKYDYLHRIINNLEPRERYIINNYYGLNGCQAKTFNRIADELNITHQYVSVLFAKTINKIKKEIKKNHYDENI